MTDLRKSLKKGDLVMRKYRWLGEPKRDYLYKVVGFGEPWQKGAGVDAKLVKVKVDGKWKKQTSAHGLSWLWDYEFKIGKKNPSQGWGKSFKFTSRRKPQKRRR